MKNYSLKLQKNTKYILKFWLFFVIIPFLVVVLLYNFFQQHSEIIQYKSIDRAGNEEVVKEQDVIINQVTKKSNLSKITKIRF